MQGELVSGDEPGVLAPSVPIDIVSRSQRQRILVAMSRSCAEKSFSKMTIADLVERANISRATFYKHFSNKRECFDLAVKEFVTELAQTIVDAQSGAEARPEAIRHAIDAMLERLADEPAYAHMVVIEAPILEPTIVASHRDQAVDALKAQWEVGEGGFYARADAKLAFGRAHLLLADYLVAGKAKKLRALAPEIVYVVLLPFLGHEEALALAQAQL